MVLTLYGHDSPLLFVNVHTGCPVGSPCPRSMGNSTSRTGSDSTARRSPVWRIRLATNLLYAAKEGAR